MKKRRWLLARAALESKHTSKWTKLNGLGCRSGRGSRRRLRESTGTGGLVRAPVDLDRTFEVRAVLDHDARGGEVTIDGAILLDLDTVFGAKVTLHGAEDHDFAGNDIGGHFGSGADGKLPLIELDQPFDRTIDQQIFTAGDLAFYVQARSEASAGAIRSGT